MTEKELDKIRTAVANYMYSEGCSCCQSIDHHKNKDVLAKLLKIPMYKDKSGYNFTKYRTKVK